MVLQPQFIKVIVLIQFINANNMKVLLEILNIIITPILFPFSISLILSHFGLDYKDYLYAIGFYSGVLTYVIDTKIDKHFKD